MLEKLKLKGELSFNLNLENIHSKKSQERKKFSPDNSITEFKEQ
jgi:hypothetical protein